MKPLRMLYVEDNADLREIFQEMLEGDRREVVACATAEEALVLWNASDFDVLVSDISLPGMSGIDLVRQVLKLQPQCWAVLCSGYEYGDAVSALGPRVRALSKPFELHDLERLMDEIHTSLDGAP
jgi:CheY-like chemotaxis protein